MSTTEAIASAIAPVADDISTNITNAVASFAGAPQSWYTMTNKADDSAEVRICDAIGAWGVTAGQFVTDLGKIKATTINLRLNTPGGSVFDGTAIHNALIEHPANVVVHVDGVAASAGSFIAMAGDEIRMADNSYMMIHNASGGVMGEADDMRRYADLLEKMNNTIAGMYERKSGKPRSHWMGLMDAETWFTAEEAKAEGLADVVEPSSKKSATGAKAAFDFKIYNKIPDPVRRMWGISPVPENTAPAHTAAEQTQAPEVLPLGNPVPAITSLEKLPMSENSPTIAPAPTAVAPVNDIQVLNQQAIEGYIARGRTLGYQEGRSAEIERMKQITAACPGKPDLAINAFISDQNAATVKLAFDAANAMQAQMNDSLRESNREVARLQAVIATGGHPGISASMGESASPAVPGGLEPEAQAKLEWDSDPMIRAQNTEKSWLLYRTQQLSGNVRVLKTAK